MERDTFFPRNGRLPDDGAPLDPADPKGNLLGHFDVSQIPPGDEGRMVAAGLKGVFLKWLIDEKFGAAHHRLLFIEYLPGVGIGAHDHTYEEAYFILSGEVEAVMDGKRYLATAGTVLWTGTGCVHTFKNISSEPVRWLETFSPQPPRENVFRFMAEWEQKAKELEGDYRRDRRAGLFICPGGPAGIRMEVEMAGRTLIRGEVRPHARQERRRHARLGTCSSRTARSRRSADRSRPATPRSSTRATAS